MTEQKRSDTTADGPGSATTAAGGVQAKPPAPSTAQDAHDAMQAAPPLAQRQGNGKPHEPANAAQADNAGSADEQLDAEQLRLMADTMPGEGPGD